MVGQQSFWQQLIGFRCQLALALLLLWSAHSHAVIDVYKFEDDVTRQRYLSFIEEMRCPKCQNQNLAGSDSPIAADLRRELHRLLEEGKSDKEIVDFMVDRYGEYVLYRPRVKTNTALLWGLPAGLLLIGGVLVGLTLRQRQQKLGQSSELSAAEQARLDELLAAAARRQSGQGSKEKP